MKKSRINSKTNAQKMKVWECRIYLKTTAKITMVSPRQTILRFDVISIFYRGGGGCPYFLRILYSVISVWLNILFRNESCQCVCLCVCVSVCQSGSLKATIFGRFLWNLEHMIITEIWDDTFLIFWKFCSNDVITATSRFFVGVLSRLQF